MRKVPVNELKLIEFLNRVPFFNQFSVTERKVFFASNMDFLSCRPGELIIKQDDKDNDFYIVLSGRAGVYVNQGNDKVAEVRGGYFLGEGAFINNRPHSATIRCEVETYLLRLDQKTLLRFPASIREKLKDQIIEGMAMRLADMNVRTVLSSS